MRLRWPEHCKYIRVHVVCLTEFCIHEARVDRRLSTTAYLVPGSEGTRFLEAYFGRYICLDIFSFAMSSFDVY